MLKVSNLEDFKKYTDEDTFNQLKVFDTMKQLLIENATLHSMDISLENSEKQINYKQLFMECRKLASYVLSYPKKTHIGILLQNSIEFVISAISIMANGFVAVFIPTSLSDVELDKLIKKYDIELLIYDNANASKVENINGHKVLVDVILNNQPSDFVYEVNKEDEAAIVFSKKENGELRGAILTHHSLLTSAFYGSLAIKDVIHQKYYSILPLTHIYGFVRNILTPLITHSSIYVNSNMRRMFKELPVVKPTMLVLVPALLQMLYNVENKLKMNLFENVHTIIVGGAAMPTYLIKEFAKKNINIFQGYGMTETSNLVSGNPSPLTKSQSVGLIFPFQTCKIINNELYISGPNIMKGYYKDIEETNKMFENGYLKTKDLAYQDEDGYLYLQGRCDDIIILTNGENVSPLKIEKRIDEIDEVVECMVYADEDLLAVDIVIRNDLSTDLENLKPIIKEKIANINNSLPSFERISKINLVTKELAKDENMKLIRKRGITNEWK